MRCKSTEYSGGIVDQLGATGSSFRPPTGISRDGFVSSLQA